MAEPHCATCEAMGYRSCDVCGNPCWEADDEGNEQNLFRDAFGRELCAYCAAPTGAR